MAASIERGTRERILEVAEAFLGERGYDGTRLHLIAQRVGIQKASLFHYFPSKEHLYRAVLHEGFGETQQTLRRVLESEGTPLEKVRALIESYVDMVAAHPERTKILLRQSLGDAPDSDEQLPESQPQQHLLEMVVNFIAEGQRAHAFAAIDPVALVLSVVGMVAFFFTSATVLAPQWCGEPLNVDRVKQYVVEIVQRCLANPKPARASAAQAG